MEVVTAVRPDAVLVPKRALVYDEDRMSVFRVRGERVERLPIVPAMMDAAWVMPPDGMAVGDTLVTAGQAGLKADARVEIVSREGGA